MRHVQRFDHIGITVADLESVTAFFVGLGLQVEGTGSMQGEFVETVCGIPGAHCEIAMLQLLRGGGTRLELSSFSAPEHVPGSPSAMANELGLRNVSFEIGDLQAGIDAVAADGHGLVGRVGEFEGMVRMAYIRARGDHRVFVRTGRLTRVIAPHPPLPQALHRPRDLPPPRHTGG